MASFTVGDLSVERIRCELEGRVAASSLEQKVLPILDFILPNKVAFAIKMSYLCHILSPPDIGKLHTQLCGGDLKYCGETSSTAVGNNFPSVKIHNCSIQPPMGRLRSNGPIGYLRRKLIQTGLKSAGI